MPRKIIGNYFCTVTTSKIYGYNLVTWNYHHKLWFLSVEKGDRFLPIDFRGILTIKIYSACTFVANCHYLVFKPTRRQKRFTVSKSINNFLKFVRSLSVNMNHGPFWTLYDNLLSLCSAKKYWSYDQDSTCSAGQK